MSDEENVSVSAKCRWCIYVWSIYLKDFQHHDDDETFKRGECGRQDYVSDTSPS